MQSQCGSVAHVRRSPTEPRSHVHRQPISHPRGARHRLEHFSHPCSVAGITDVVQAFLRREAFECVSDGLAEFVEGSLGGGSQEGFELGEDLLDGIEVGTVGREIEDSGSGLFDGLADALDFVGGEIVHDDDVPLRQRWGQLLADVGEKEFAVERPVDHQRSHDPASAETCEEGGRLPMAVRDFGEQPLTARGAAAQSRHLGRRPRLVEKDQPLDRQAALRQPMPQPTLRHVRPILLGGVNDFF